MSGSEIVSIKELFDSSIDINSQSHINETTLAIPPTNGIYLFTDPKDQPIQLLMGANLRNLIRRRLIEKNSDAKSKRVELREIVARVYTKNCHSQFETQIAYYKIAKQVYPKSFTELFSSLDAWYIHIDASSNYPTLLKTKQLSGSGQNNSILYYGPFPTAKSADNFIETLQEIFCLCRFPAKLSKAPNATACSYAQMEKCPSPCDGSISIDEYKQIVQQAIDLLATGITKTILSLDNEIKDLSQELRFEEAQKLSEKLKQVKKLTGSKYRWVKEIRSFRIISIQKGPKVKVPDKRAAQPTIIPFIISPDEVRQLDPFLLSDATSKCKTLLDTLDTLKTETLTDIPNHQQQLFAWIANLLYSGGSKQGLFFDSESLSAEKLAKDIIDHFSKANNKATKKPALDSFNL